MKRIQGVLEIGPLVFLYVDICGKIHSYTDWHDVDEDLRTIPSQGGRWTAGSSAGTACRTMNDSPTTTLDTVASSDIRN